MGLDPLRKPKQQIFIRWIPPPTGWVKLNTDRCYKVNPGLASGGGLLRDEDGKWIKGFDYNIGICTVTMSELWAIYHGLTLAWNEGYRRVLVETDSRSAALILKKDVILIWVAPAIGLTVVSV